MKTTYTGKGITSLLAIIPENESFFDDEVDNYTFPAKQTLRLKRVMGYEKHRLSKDSTTVSDLAVYGLEYIFENNWTKKEERGGNID